MDNKATIVVEFGACGAFSYPGPRAGFRFVGSYFFSQRKGIGDEISFFDCYAVGGKMVKLLVRDKESIQEAVRRFRKLVERSGIKKEMRRREHFEKPSETKRRARLRAERRSKRMRLMKNR